MKIRILFLCFFIVSSTLQAKVKVLCPEEGECLDWDGSPCTLPNHSLYLTDEGLIYYHSSTLLAGFQFYIEGASLISALGGEAEAAGFTMPTGNNIVLGFSMEGNTITGCGTMVILELEGKVGDLSNLVISNPKGEAIPFLIYY